MKKLLLMTCIALLAFTTGYAQNTHHGGAEPDKKAKELQKELKLTNVQTTKIAAVYEESAKKFDKIKVEEKGNTNKMMEAIKPVRATTIAKIKAILTPAQAAKYQKMVSENGGANANGWSDGWSTSSE